MSDKTKKILLIVLFIIIVIIIGLLIYFLFFQAIITPEPTPTKPTPTTPVTIFPPTPPIIPVEPGLVNVPPQIPPPITSITPTSIIPGPTISPIAQGGITSFRTLEAAPTISPKLTNNGSDLVYYNKDTGFFQSITSDGVKRIISDVAFKNVENVIWAPNNQQAILEYPDGSNIIYDFNKKSSVTLPAHWKDFIFSPDGKKIAFKDMKLDPENRFIAISNSNGSNYEPIEEIGDKDMDVHLSWAPNNKYIALYRESIDFDRSEVYPIGFNGENFKKFKVEGRDLRFEWTPSGNKLLYSVYNSRSNYNPTLWVVNTHPELLASGRNKLGINTWADKCTFASEIVVYCAVPKKLEMGTGLIPSLADNTADDIYKINILTGTKTLTAQPLYPVTAQELIISDDGKTLYIHDKNSGEIKKVNL